MKTILASSGTLEGINKIINHYYYCTKELIPISENKWQIKGIRVSDTSYVLKKKNRYQFVLDEIKN